jgi:hypothetical protein
MGILVRFTMLGPYLKGWTDLGSKCVAPELYVHKLFSFRNRDLTRVNKICPHECRI